LFAATPARRDCCLRPHRRRPAVPVKLIGMHAIEIAEHGGPEVLNYVDRPRPSPGPGEVFIKAVAIGVIFVDTYFRSGLYPH
jgi:hypothetical protein